MIIGAIWIKRKQTGLGFAEKENTGWEFDFMILGELILLIFTCAGSMGLD